MPVSVERTGRATRLVSAAAARRLGQQMTRALAAMEEQGAELAIALVDDDEIRVMNRTWRDVDAATDVLSFSMREGEGGALHPGLLGDVAISVETAARQAAEQGAGRTLDDELLHLAVHGLVHLCGYDHATPDEERVMFALEAEVRATATGQGPPTK